MESYDQRSLQPALFLDAQYIDAILVILLSGSAILVYGATLACLPRDSTPIAATVNVLADPTSQARDAWGPRTLTKRHKTPDHTRRAANPCLAFAIARAKSLALGTSTSIGLQRATLRYHSNAAPRAVVYAALDARAAPLIPNFGINARSRTTVTSVAAATVRSLDSGWPLTTRSLVIFFQRLSDQIPGNRSRKGLWDATNWLPNRVRISHPPTNAHAMTPHSMVTEVKRFSGPISALAPPSGRDATRCMSATPKAPGGCHATDTTFTL